MFIQCLRNMIVWATGMGSGSGFGSSCNISLVLIDLQFHTPEPMWECSSQPHFDGLTNIPNLVRLRCASTCTVPVRERERGLSSESGLLCVHNSCHALPYFRPIFICVVDELFCSTMKNNPRRVGVGYRGGLGVTENKYSVPPSFSHIISIFFVLFFVPLGRCISKRHH